MARQHGPDDLLQGRFQGTTRFALERELGTGAMGIVYGAYDRERKTRVALKLLRRFDPAAILRFKREFRALADMAHRNVVNLYELVSAGDDWFFTMELIDGIDFLEYVRAGWSGGSQGTGGPASSRASGVAAGSGSGPVHGSGGRAAAIGASDIAETLETRDVPVATIVAKGGGRERGELAASAAVAGGGEEPLRTPAQFERLRDALRQLVEGVHALHRAGHLHRDIKPSNILVDRDGRVVLLDFGVVMELSRLVATDADEIAGTPAYMAPEQASTGALTEACDWYAVGTVLFEALTRRRPFAGTVNALLKAKAESDPPPPRRWAPDIPDDLNDLCVDLLARLPAARPNGEQILARLALARESVRPEPRAAAVAEDGEVTLVGRERYLETLHEELARARSSSARTVLLAGPSGAGKSALMHHAARQMKERHQALILEGRCYERESVPYKALDNLMDNLCQHLLGRPEGELERLLPEGFDALAQLFPVLRRLGACAVAPDEIQGNPEPHERRHRAFRALREILRVLGVERPLVLCLDDVQWGDVDGAMALAEVLRVGMAPPLLVLATCRSEDVDTSEFLAALVPEIPDITRIDVAAMTFEEARRLARVLLERGGDRSLDEVEEESAAIATESGGDPMFVIGLARFARQKWGGRRSRPGGHSASLEQVIDDRLAELDDGARRLLEVIAVAERPVVEEVALLAAGLGDDGHRALAVLRSDHLVRSSSSGGGRAQVAPYHDRIRLAVVNALSDAARRDYHAHLARVLEPSGEADAEALARHFAGAGDDARAGHYEALAGDQAFAALAFARAAEHYDRALGLREHTAEKESELRGKRADALAHAGRGAESGRMFLTALAGAAASQALVFQRRAAEQLLTSGHIDEGLAALRAALDAVGLRFPSGNALTFIGLAFTRARLRLRGTGFRRRKDGTAPPQQLVRLDVCWSAVIGFAYCDVIRVADFLSRYQLLAYRIGELRHVVRGLVAEIVYAGGAGHSTRKRTKALLSKALALAAQCDDPHARGLALSAAAYRSYPLGEFAEAVAYAERASKVLRERCTGVTWELDMAEMVRLWSLYYLGRTGELMARLPAMLRDARQRSDWFMVTSLCTTVLNSYWLLDDDVAEARRVCRAAMARWPSSLGVLLQHYWEIVALVQADLYAGEGAEAWRRISERWRPLRRSPVMLLEVARVESLDLHARAALSAVRAAADPGERRKLLAHARRDASQVERRTSSMTRPLAALIRAGIAACEERPHQALENLVAAEGGFDQASMALHAACARYRRGQVLGGDEGASLVADARRTLSAERARKPARIVAMLAPGFED